MNNLYGNLKAQMKFDLCICEALSYNMVPWKLLLWTRLSFTTTINYADSCLLANLLFKFN